MQLHRDGQLVMGAVGNLLVDVWTQMPTPAALSRVDTAMRQLIRQHQKVGSLIISVFDAQGLSLDFTKKAAEMMGTWGTALKGVAMVQCSKGALAKLVGAGMRTTTIYLRTADHDCPTKQFEDPEAGAEWLVKTLEEQGALVGSAEAVLGEIRKFVASAS